MNVIGCRWVYRIKRWHYGSIDRFKALVAKGFSQQEGINYVKTFSPVVRPTIRVVLSLAVNHG